MTNKCTKCNDKGTLLIRDEVKFDEVWDKHDRMGMYDATACTQKASAEADKWVSCPLCNKQ